MIDRALHHNKMNRRIRYCTTVPGTGIIVPMATYSPIIGTGAYIVPVVSICRALPGTIYPCTISPLDDNSTAQTCRALCPSTSQGTSTANLSKLILEALLLCCCHHSMPICHFCCKHNIFWLLHHGSI